MVGTLRQALDLLGGVVLGKDTQLRLSLACLLARGHLLIEDIPGIGKTTLAKALAVVLGLEFKRVQFTNDLLPADVLGVSVFDAAASSFVFHPGPVFTNVLLADEINRGTPRTQSALLEVMEEQQVSLDNSTRLLPRPFFVLATQNALDQAGTYPLPESQLDRFLFRISLGYPDLDSELELLGRSQTAGRPVLPEAVSNAEEVLDLQEQVDHVRTSAALLRYVRDLLDWTRTSGRFVNGLSPRAGQALVRASRAWAFLDGRDFVLPEDVQAVFPSLAGHRLRSADGAGVDLAAILAAVPIP
ncbi:MoxR family ATPase [Desulfomicrobium sp. ZS1]|uniref:AAA family ATPase n=1 Tax=Desulfomicrobium sp. ZS1 TaxID=2952228 RepID=UPI0020B18244|nr:MoxR family ATPase [Desulfomicrobium sp. ZS1]UTF50807.1 MoxR family ATPase [Desulfomicrobium sp. ZS1]